MPEWLESRSEPSFAAAWQPVHPARLLEQVRADRRAGLMSPAQVLRSASGRTTLLMSLGGRACVVKLHDGVGWREIIKNLLCLRPPVLDAGNEWRGLQRLAEAGIPAPRALAMARAGRNPARRKSYLVMSRLENTLSLEEVCAAWRTAPPAPGFRFALTRELAGICRALHEAGVAHRDCYLCHFHLRLPSAADSGLYLLDLHRALVRPAIAFRWRVKDLAGLLFSALELGLTRRDLLRFICGYSGLGLRETLRRDRRLWRAVWRRARRAQKRLTGGAWPFDFRV